MSMMGQTTPAKDDVIRAVDLGERPGPDRQDQGFIIDLKKNMMYIINHGNKSYVETTLPLDYRQAPSAADGGHGRDDDHDGHRHPGRTRRRRSATGTARSTT